MKGEVQLEALGGSNPSDTDPLLHAQHVDSSPSSSSASETPNEIKVEDLESGSLPCCRICLECDGEDGRIDLFYNFLHLYACLSSYAIAIASCLGQFLIFCFLGFKVQVV